MLNWCFVWFCLPVLIQGMRANLESGCPLTPGRPLPQEVTSGSLVSIDWGAISVAGKQVILVFPSSSVYKSLSPLEIPSLSRKGQMVVHYSRETRHWIGLQTFAYVLTSKHQCPGNVTVPNIQLYSQLWHSLEICYWV